ncbi:MAG: response regulator [Treponema sp.]|jgi:putative two-component system response regulator|nr:response regulator [Treponema sp.]
MADKAPVVLVVDDVELNVMILEEILKDDYYVITASNGKEALELLGDSVSLPKLILLDVVMPEMTGREMFELMKTNEKLKRIPVIFITAENDSESELLAAGAVDFINKPFLPEIVKLRVKNQIELKNYSDSLEQMVAEKAAEATKTLENALQGLANVIEHRDLESGEHVKRTQLFVKALIDHLVETDSVYAEELLKLQPDIIMKSMALHDVGKIAIPDKILLKPGKLDPEEYEIMKTHTVRGKEIIHELGDVNTSIYLKHCEDICYSHHERWDGKGYPWQLKGEQIPLTARLAALADVYDALVCARVYKAAMPYEEAIDIIIQGKHVQFDPVIADAVVQIQDKFREISRNYQ